MPGGLAGESIARIGPDQAARRVRAVLGDGALLGNLECPLSDTPPDRPAKADGGPNLRAPTATADWLLAAGFAAMALANNHIADCGAAGIASTRLALQRAGFEVTRKAPPPGPGARAVTCSAGRVATSDQRPSSPTR